MYEPQLAGKWSIEKVFGNLQWIQAEKVFFFHFYCDSNDLALILIYRFRVSFVAVQLQQVERNLDKLKQNGCIHLHHTIK